MNGCDEMLINKLTITIKSAETINTMQVMATPIVRGRFMGNQTSPLLIDKLPGPESRRSFVLLLWFE